jgi:polysaccharide biosynthesis protein PslH
MIPFLPEAGSSLLHLAMPTARLLFLTPVSPWASASGAEQRSALLLEALQALGTVDVVQLTPGPVMQARRKTVDGIQMVYGEVPGASRPFRYRPKPDLTGAIEASLGKPLSSYDLIVGRYLWSMCQLALPGGVRTLVDLDDFRYRYGPQAGWSFTLATERLVKTLSHLLARRQLARFDAAFVVSEADQTLLGAMPNAVLSNVPWSAPAQVAPPAVGKQVLFVGSLWYRPNADGIDWFLAKVWPQVRAAHAQATLHLVGPAPPARREGWEKHPGVTAPGFVDDVGAAYAAAALVVVPVHSGGGSNIKVLEALGYGRACVLSSLALDAFRVSLRSGEHLLEAGDASAFAAHIIRLLDDPLLRSRLAESGLHAVRESFERRRFLECARAWTTRCLATDVPSGRAGKHAGRHG